MGILVAKKNQVLKEAKNLQGSQKSSEWSGNSEYGSDSDNDVEDLENLENISKKSLKNFEDLASLIQSPVGNIDITENFLRSLDNFSNLTDETRLELLNIIESILNSVVPKDGEGVGKSDILDNIRNHKESIEAKINFERGIEEPIYPNLLVGSDFNFTEADENFKIEQEIGNEAGKQVNRFLLTTQQPNINISTDYVNIGPSTRVVVATRVAPETRADILEESVNTGIILGRKPPLPPPPLDMRVDTNANILQLNGVNFLPQDILPPPAFR